MMLRSLNSLFGSDEDRSICQLSLDGTEVISLRQLRSDLIRLKARIETVDASSWLLYSDSTYNFALSLLVLLGLKKTVLVCASNKSGWVAQFENQFEAVLSDSSVVVSDKLRIDIEYAPTPTEIVGELWTPIFTGAEEISFFTSGSTGEPKCIKKPLRLLLREIQTLETRFGDSVGQALFVASVSHHHIYGLLFKLLWPLLTARMWLNRQIDYPEQLLSVAQNCDDIVFVSSPGLLSHLDVSLPSVKMTSVFSSGGPLSYAAAMNAKAWLTELPIEVYGSTETGGIAYRQQTVFEAPWTLFPGITLNPTHGHVELFSPHLPAGGPILLDDVILLAPDGTFTLQGRKDRIVKIAEKRVSLTGIERQAECLDTIERCIALTLQDGRQTIGCAVVLSHAGLALLAEKDLTWLAKQWKQAMAIHFDRVAIPRKWRILQSLPTNSQGKIDTAFIAELFRPVGSTGVDLPTVSGVSRLARGVDLELLIDSGLNVFDGHFDGAPIVPGVVQIKWVIDLSRQYLGHLMPSGTETLLSVKFQNVIRPGQKIKMNLDITDDRLDFVLSSGRGRHSSGKIALT